MYLVKKLKEQGWHWFIRRIVREFAQPSTRLGKYFQRASFFIHWLINKPINFIALLKAKGNTKDCLYFFYDFEVEPITYDFAWALCIANAKREELGLTHLQVVFVPGFEQGLRKESSVYEQIVNQDARRWRIYSILLPIIKLLPCSPSILFCTSRDEARLIKEQQAQYVYPEKYNVTFPVPYTPTEIIDYHQTLLSLQADKQALDYVAHWLSKHAGNRKIIVITLRQYGYIPERNSNVAAWLQFAETLNKNDFFVVFVPDTEQALETNNLGDFPFFHPACWNLHMRCALYELAFLNLGINTGPMSLCWLNSRCRYLSFKTWLPNVALAPLEALLDRGFVPGENPRFTKLFQKWIWDTDDFDVIVREFWLMYHSIIATLGTNEDQHVETFHSLPAITVEEGL
jgi:hypothetical protein